MKILSRDFTTREKILLLILVIILLALSYYRFVDVPVREGIEAAKAEQETSRIELAVVNKKIESLERMKTELDEIIARKEVAYMPSYNNAKNVNRLLNDVLSGLEYVVTYTNLTRDGNQIRRNVSIQFTSPDYTAMETVLRSLAESEYRCLVDDLRGTVTTQRNDEAITVNLTSTFYETMVGGTADAGLPADRSAK